MEYKDNLIKSNPEVGQIKLGEFLKAANLVPETWTTSDGLYMTDSIGNGNASYLNNQGHVIVVDIYFAKYSNSQAAEMFEKACFNNVAVIIVAVIARLRNFWQPVNNSAFFRT